MKVVRIGPCILIKDEISESTKINLEFIWMESTPQAVRRSDSTQAQANRIGRMALPSKYISSVV